MLMAYGKARRVRRKEPLVNSIATLTEFGPGLRRTAYLG